MADSAAVVKALMKLRDSLAGLAMRTASTTDRNIPLQRATASGNLAQACAKQFRGRDMPDGVSVIAFADSASAAADAASGGDTQETGAVIEAALKVPGVLPKIGTSGASSFAGSLRVTPTRHAMAHASPAGPEAAISAEAGEAIPPAYAADVAKLFPVEAATIFPLGLTIAGGNAALLAIIIVITALFVVALRYFATRADGETAWTEIIASLISFLLWVGATKGYWVSDGGIDTGIPAKDGAAMFGFVTIIWVALAPYLVKEKVRRDANATATDKAGAPTLAG